jgi:hypothetical protein
MTRKEAERLNAQEYALLDLGFTRQEAEQLRRISMTLHRWYERECNGEIERAGENSDGAPYASFPNSGTHRAYRIPDRERGAERRLQQIIDARNARMREEVRAGLTSEGHGEPIRSYLQGDPHGAALYIIRPGDVPEGQDVRSYYNRGLCVY